MGFFSKLFGGSGGGNSALDEALKGACIIIDVRTRQEYKEGHIKGSVNIPLNHLPKEVKRLKTKKNPIILCCRSGARAGSAASLLKKSGIECFNGGGWISLRKRLAQARKG